MDQMDARRIDSDWSMKGDLRNLIEVCRRLRTDADPRSNQMKDWVLTRMWHMMLSEVDDGGKKMQGRRHHVDRSARSSRQAWNLTQRKVQEL